MCVICRDWQLGKLTNKEALRALGELISSTDDSESLQHLWKVSDSIMDNEVPLSEIDEEIDKKWHEENH